MSIRMNRIFHPVGQGAYYEEQFYDCNNKSMFNFVYDCGTSSKANRIEEIIKKDKKNKIDLLCISHFDRDHISHIKQLKDKMEIKNIMMPLLGLEDTLISLINILNQEESSTYANILLDPVGFFTENGSDSNIIFVDEKRTKDTDAWDDNLVDINIENISNRITILETGQKLIIKDVWNYIPFNYKYKRKEVAFIDCIKRSLIEIRFNEGNESIKKQILDLIDNKVFIDKLKSCYEKVKEKVLTGEDDSTTNINSLVVCSNSIKQSYGQSCNINHNAKEYYRYKLGCLYCGDYNARNDNLRDALITFYRSDWRKIGIIQIPHHGSIRNYSKAITNYIPKALISHGNRHGHPSKEVIDCLKKRNKEIIEKTQSCAGPYIERICINNI